MGTWYLIGVDHLPIQEFFMTSFLTLSVPVILLNSPNLRQYFSLNKLERILLLIFSSFLCLINSYFLITKCHILYVKCKEKMGVENCLGLKGLIKYTYMWSIAITDCTWKFHSITLSLPNKVILVKSNSQYSFLFLAV